MSTTNQSDFCNVRLSAEGAKIAGPNGQIRVTGLQGKSHFSYAFTAANPTRVLTSEWTKVLIKEAIGGVRILELAPATVPVPAKGADAPAAAPSALAAETTETAEQAPKSTKGGK